MALWKYPSLDGIRKQCTACGLVFFRSHECTSVRQGHLEDGYRGRNYSFSEQLDQGFALLARIEDEE